MGTFLGNAMGWEKPLLGYPNYTPLPCGDTSLRPQGVQACGAACWDELDTTLTLTPVLTLTLA